MGKTQTAQNQNAQMVPAVKMDGTISKITVTATSAQSSAFGTTTHMVVLASNTDLYYKTAANPTATTSDNFFPGGNIFAISVNPGDKIAAIRSSADGIMTVTEVI